MLLSTVLKFTSIGWVGGAMLVGLLMNGDKLYSWVGKKISDEAEWMEVKLELMFYRVTHEQVLRYYTLYLASLFMLGVLVVWPSIGFGFILGLLITFVGWKIPGKFIASLHRSRINRFVHQMVDGLSLMSNALKSGLNVPQALQLVADELGNPISQEFNLVLSENKLGVTLEEALIHLSNRMPHDDIEMFTTSVNILKETGGNLAETFATIAYTIRERIKVESKIAAMVSQGVMQGVIVVIMPFALGGILYTIDPERVAPMFTTIPGWVLLLIMMSLQFVGGYAIWKIVQVKV